MNKKQIFKGLIIFLSTLFAGFTITVLSFNLFSTMTPNQMKLLFAFDILSLLAIGSIVYLFSENKENTAKKEKELTERHNKRIAERNNEMSEILKIIDNSNFAA